jgi:hypothetical protein
MSGRDLIFGSSNFQASEESSARDGAQNDDAVLVVDPLYNHFFDYRLYEGGTANEGDFTHSEDFSEDHDGALTRGSSVGIGA